MRFYPEHLTTDASMGADVTSTAIQVKQMFGACFECVVSAGASPVGILYVEGSATGDNYVALTGMNQAVAADGTFIFDVVNTNVQYLRIFYDRTSGTGTLNVYTYAKGF